MSECLLKKVSTPKMAMICQKINTQKIKDLNSEIKKELDNICFNSIIKKEII